MAFNYYNNNSIIGKNSQGTERIIDLDNIRILGGALFEFTSFTFTTGGGHSPVGQSLSTFLAHSDYNTSTYTWLSDTNFFDVTTNDGTYPVGIQLFTIPKTGTYRINARGAYGGAAGSGSGTSSTYTGGVGATIQGDFDLIAGEKIEILVGNPGDTYYRTSYAYGGACGGGGTFVIKEGGNTTSDILVIAGGGGGAEYASNSRNTSTHGGSGRPSTVSGGAGGNSSQMIGSYGAAAPNYSAGSFGDIARGGINGYGGGGAVGGGGGGFFDRGGTGNATTSVTSSASQAGLGYLTGTGYTSSLRGRGGQSNRLGEFGGFGGGGGAQELTGYGGGGGGYSGGGAGNFNGTQGNGGGGGSYNNGANKVETTYTQANHPGTVVGVFEPFVEITLL